MKVVPEVWRGSQKLETSQALPLEPTDGEEGRANWEAPLLPPSFQALSLPSTALVAEPNRE